ncbi:MAG: cation transporter [Clostridia bacterium]|nr:cation transporter [Clostridia bacterium]
MNTLIKKLFIKNYKQTSNPIVRAAYGVVAGILGIIFNVILFTIKLLAGILSGSIAIIADAINNLSDFMTSIVTVIGFKISRRPADKEHPFGHQRIEYITALLVACIITFIGVETLRSGVGKIISNSPTLFSVLTCIILGVSILIKIIMFFIYRGFANDIKSDALRAMSTDSLNDVVSTLAVLVCVVVGLVWNIALDGYFGIAVSVLVIFSAVKLIKTTIDPLIGTPPDKDLVSKIKAKFKNYDDVLDIHDLIVHAYGPTKIFATVHIEVGADVDVMISHDLADNIERDFYKDLNVFLVCHLDPVNVSDEETLTLKNEVLDSLKQFEPAVSMHDFRVVKGVSHTNVVFDVVIPHGAHFLEPNIKSAIEERLSHYDKKYYAVIEFEHNYND